MRYQYEYLIKEEIPGQNSGFEDRVDNSSTFTKFQVFMDAYEPCLWSCNYSIFFFFKKKIILGENFNASP